MEYSHSAGEATSPISRALTDIETLINLIKEEFQEYTYCKKKSLLHAKRIGDLLLEAKPHVPSRHWEEWVEQNFPFTRRTAKNYIDIAESWESLISENVSDFLLADAYRYIKEQRAKEKGRENTKSEKKLLGAAPVTDLKKLLSQIRHDLNHFKRISWKASAVSTRIPQVIQEISKTRDLINEIESLIRQDCPSDKSDSQIDSSAA